MTRWQKFWFALTLAPFLAGVARAQEPKAGKPYKNENLGFEFKAPEKWDSIGAEPNEKNLVVKFDPATQKQILLGNDPTNKRPVGLDLHFWVVKFDRRKPAGAAAEPDDDKIDLGHSVKDLKAWMPQNVGTGMKPDGAAKETVINKIPVTYQEYLSKAGDPLAYRVAAYVFKYEPDLEIALICNGPGDAKKWNKYGQAFGDIAKSFRRLKDDGKPDEVVDTSKMSFRDKRKLEIEATLKDAPSWKLYVTENYFIISSNTDKLFIDELMGRAEAIHKIYEQDYPASKAEEYKKLAESTKTGDKKDEKEDGEARLAKAIFGDTDPKELAKCSVIRVCLDRDQYHSYGGPGGSAGYWNWTAQELVIYDDKKDGGRKNTWSVLNHEGFHQYIFYFFGNISPQSWFNEGTGDFYSGYEYKNRQFKLEKFDWRTDTIKTALKAGATHDLEKFVKMTQQEYYSESPLEKLPNMPNVSMCYAQGWSFIYFLRTGKKGGARNWDPKWDGILEAYLKTLAMTGDTDQAVKQAFDGIDFNALQESWAAYTLK